MPEVMQPTQLLIVPSALRKEGRKKSAPGHVLKRVKVKRGKRGDGPKKSALTPSLQSSKGEHVGLFEVSESTTEGDRDTLSVCRARCFVADQLSSEIVR